MSKTFTPATPATVSTFDVDWTQLGIDSRLVTKCETLQNEKQRSVYRLHVQRSDFPTLVLKRSPADQAEREATFYGEVLPRLANLPRLSLLGSCPGGPEKTWLLMEDAGEELFDWQDPEHQVLAASWLGRLHLFGVSTDLSGIPLRDRGPEHFWDHATTARRAVEENRVNRLLSADQTMLLDRLLERLRVVEGAWPALVAECAGFPQTLVHGDFKPDNLRIRSTEQGRDLVVFDWNEGGWGLPALDLSRFLRSELADRPNTAADDALLPWIHRMSPDVATYLSIVQPIWPDLEVATVRRIGQIGELFRCVASTRWQAVRLAYDWVDGPIEHLRCFDEWLGSLIEVLEW